LESFGLCIAKLGDDKSILPQAVDNCFTSKCNDLSAEAEAASCRAAIWTMQGRPAGRYEPAMPFDDDRLAYAAAFVAALFQASRRSPRDVAPGQCDRRIGRHREAAALTGDPDAVLAGLIDRRVDDDALVLITDKGRALAEGKQHDRL
jgi:hypothetical protein